VTYIAYAVLIYLVLVKSKTEDQRSQLVVDRAEKVMTSYMELNLRIMNNLYLACGQEINVLATEPLSREDLLQGIARVNALASSVDEDDWISKSKDPGIIFLRKEKSGDLCETLAQEQDVYCETAAGGVLKKGKTCSLF
jgi:hypothetical protein